MNQKHVKKVHSLTFRKWQSKNYSVFNSLKQVIRIGTLSIAYLLVKVPSSAVFAQDDTLQITQPRDEEIDEIVISGQQTAVLNNELSRVVQVITKEEIERSPATSTAELLQYAMNVDARQRGTHGVQTDISIRGGSFDQVMILLNGVNISDPQTGHHHLNLPLDLESIERIEILEGPGARFFGPNAYSGAINIITGARKTNAIAVNGVVGQHQYLNTGINATLSSENLVNFFSFNRKSSGGYIENTDFRSTHLFYNGNLYTSLGNLEWQTGFNEKGFGANSFYTAKYPDQYENTTTYFGSVKFKSKSIINLEPTIYWRRHQDRFELFRESVYEKTENGLYVDGVDTAGFPLPGGGLYPYAGHNYHMTDIYGANLKSHYKWLAGQTAFGAGWRREVINSNVLGNSTGDTLSVPGEPAGFFTKYFARDQLNFYLEHKLDINNFFITGGILLHANSDLDWEPGIFPGIDLGYKLKDYHLFFSYNHSLRMPTFTDMFYVGPTNLGNINLLPEKANSYETGIKYSKPYLTAYFAAFYNDAYNVIDWVKVDVDEKWESKNITEIGIYGTELYMKLNTSQLKKASLPVNFITLNYAFIYQQKSSSQFISKYVLDYLRHKAVLGVDHDIISKLKASWRLTLQDREGSFSDASTGKEIPYKPFLLMDGKIYWKAKFYTLYFETSNIFNSSYYDIGNVIQPGIWFRGGFKANINL